MRDEELEDISDDSEDVYLWDDDDLPEEGEGESGGRRRLSMPSVSMPRPRMPNVGVPDGAKAVLASLLFLAMLFGPHVIILSDRVADQRLFGEFSFFSTSVLTGVLDGGDSEGDASPSIEGDIAELLAELPESVPVPEDAGEYDRETFMSSWTDVNNSGCTTREDVLIEAFVDATIDGCSVVPGTGEALSLYDGVVVTDPGDLDIDHVVALEDMFRSGAWEWGEERRREAAQDPQNLIAVSASSNRAKGSRGPDEWGPDAEGEASCVYAEVYVVVKHEYELSVTASERDALVGHLATCDTLDG